MSKDKEKRDDKSKDQDPKAKPAVRRSETGKQFRNRGLERKK